MKPMKPMKHMKHMKHMNPAIRSLARSGIGQGFRSTSILIAVAVLGFAAPTGNAATTKWKKGLDPAPNAIWDWTDAANWSANVPVDGDTISFDDGDILPNPGNTPVGIDTKGATLNLPAANFLRAYGGRLLAYFDSDYLTPNANPLASQSDFTPVLPATTLQEAAAASPTLTIDTLNFHETHREHFFMPVVVDNLNVGMGQSTGSPGPTFWGPLSATNVVVDNTRTTVNRSSLVLNNTTTMNSLTILKSGQVYFNDNTATVGALTFDGGDAVLYVNTTALTLPAAVTVSAGGQVQIDKPQTTWPTDMLTIEEHGSLTGDMTLADFTPTTGNVDLQDGAVFGLDGGTGAPTLAQLGGTAILYEPLTRTGPNTINVGHDGTTIYKGAAFGPTYAFYRAEGKTLTANAGSGDLELLYLYNGPDMNAVKLYGDGTSTTANIQAAQLGSVRIVKAFNYDFRADYDAEPNLIRTFNITAEQGAEKSAIMSFASDDDAILAEQTFNVSNGIIYGTTSLTGDMQGTLNLTNGIFTQPGDDFDALDGNLSIAGTTIMEVTNPANLDFLEALDARFTFSGMTVVALAEQKDYAIDYSPTGANPVLANLLVNADIANNSYRELRLTGDLKIGHEKYYQNSLYRANNNVDGVKSSNGSKIVPAGNAPLGEKDVLGLAAVDGPLNISVEVDATGAIIRCGSDDPNRILKAYSSFEKVIADRLVRFKQAVTADEIQIRSGSAQFDLDLVVPSIDIGANTELIIPSGKTATVTDTLSGSGDIDNGGTVLVAGTGTLAPGGSVGTLGDGSGYLDLADGATYSLEVADPTAGAGTGYDTINVNTLESLGALTIDLAAIDGLTPGETSTSDVYVIATAGSYTGTGDFTVGGDVTVTGTGWNTSAATLGFNGNDLELSGVVYTGTAGSPYDTWANGTFVPPLTQKLPTDNQDGDSLDNLLEFAFGTQPTVSTGGIDYVSGGTVTTPGAPKIVAAGGTYSMVFGRRADYVAAGLTYTVQFSAGLDNWADNDDLANPPVQVATDGTINAMSVTYPDLITTPSGTQKPTFSRVKVVLAP